MALINCPECGNEVSTSAMMCPKCGYPINGSNNNESSQNISEKEDSSFNEPFPSMPTVMNVGNQIVNWGFDAAIQNAYYLQEINATNYLEDGKCDILAHTNGINLSAGLKSFYISHEQLINLKFISHKQLISEKKSVIGRAVVGGVLLGPLAAVVGGLSGIGSKTKKLGDYLLVIDFWDVYTHQVQSILLCTKIESVLFLERVEKEKQKHNTPEGNNYVCNILEDSKTISDEKAIEALKIVGQGELAKAISYIDKCGEATAYLKVKEIGARNKIDVSQYKSAGCMVALIMNIAGLLSLLSVFVLLLSEVVN